MSDRKRGPKLFNSIVAQRAMRRTGFDQVTKHVGHAVFDHLGASRARQRRRALRGRACVERAVGGGLVGERAVSLRPRVYVAGPISLGDVEQNVRRAIAVGLRLLDLGYAPFIPHLSYYANHGALAGSPQYERWLELDFSFIAVCHALLRLPGKSAWADREVAFALRSNIRVFHSVEDLLTGCPLEPSKRQTRRRLLRFRLPIA